MELAFGTFDLIKLGIKWVTIEKRNQKKKKS